MRWRGAKVRVEITSEQATYTVENGQSTMLELAHHGTPFSLSPGAPVTLPIEAITPLTPRPTQPAGRAPTKALSQD